MQEVMEKIITALVDKPEEVDLKQTGSERVVIFEVRVAKEDLGKVIGKKGNTARALRTILNIMAKKAGKTQAILEIVED